MTSLKELKDKWFIDVTDEKAFPPKARYPGSSIKPHTDGNLVEPLIDGAAIMGDFFRRLEQMIQCDDPSRTVAMLAAMGIDPVKPLGEDVAVDIVRTVALESTLSNLVGLDRLVFIRTFISGTASSRNKADGPGNPRENTMVERIEDKVRPVIVWRAGRCFDLSRGLA